MKTTVLIDEAGRMVLPKAVRQAIGIDGPTSLKIEIVAGAAHLSTVPARPATAVARRRGRAVYTGPLPAGWDSGEAVSRVRKQSLRK